MDDVWLTLVFPIEAHLCVLYLIALHCINLLLQASLNSPSALMRTTVVTAMKFTISDQPQGIDSLLKTSIGPSWLFY